MGRMRRAQAALNPSERKMRGYGRSPDMAAGVISLKKPPISPCKVGAGASDKLPEAHVCIFEKREGGVVLIYTNEVVPPMVIDKQRSHVIYYGGPTPGVRGGSNINYMSPGKTIMIIKP